MIGKPAVTQKERIHMAQRTQLDDSRNPLREAYACLLANGLDGAGEALRILVNDASRIERAQHLQGRWQVGTHRLHAAGCGCHQVEFFGPCEYALSVSLQACQSSGGASGGLAGA